ncbi:MAG: type II toxin-antitoxin system VapC family toxin, partial [Actinomycetota bacterium]
LVKLFIRDEEGTRTAEEIWDASDVVVTSRVAYPEGRAALASAHRARRLTARSFRQARGSLDTWFRQVAVVELDAPVAEIAGDVAERFALRAYDAIHLASALAIGSDDLVLLTWDERLAAAGRRAALDVVP